MNKRKGFGVMSCGCGLKVMRAAKCNVQRISQSPCTKPHHSLQALDLGE